MKIFTPVRSKIEFKEKYFFITNLQYLIKIEKIDKVCDT